MKILASLAIVAAFGLADPIPAVAQARALASRSATPQARVTLFQGVTGCPAVIQSMWVHASGAPGTHFETFIQFPGGPLEPFGLIGTIPASGHFVGAFSGGPPQPPVQRVGVWSVSSAPVRVDMVIG